MGKGTGWIQRVVSSPEETNLRVALKAVGLFVTSTLTFTKSWTLYFQRMNKTYFVFAWLESNLRVLKACHLFERGDPVVWLDWHVPGAPGQHTLSCPWEPGCMRQPAPDTLEGLTPWRQPALQCWKAVRKFTAYRQFLLLLKHSLDPKWEISGWKEYHHDLL